MKTWQKWAGIVVLLGMGAYALASGHIQVGFEAIKKAAEQIGIVEPGK